MNTMRSALKPPSEPQALPLLLSFHNGSRAAFLTCARNSMRSWPSALVKPPAHALSHEMRCPSHRTAPVGWDTAGVSALSQTWSCQAVWILVLLSGDTMAALESPSSMEVVELCVALTCHNGAWHLQNLQQLL